MSERTIERFAWYCSCGASCVGKADPKSFEEIRSAWELMHSGDGHEPCTREKCYRVRFKSDKEAVVKPTGKE